MTLELSLEELLDILDGRLAVGMMSDRVGPVVTDTRGDIENAWFLCLAGERFDGHDFIGEAFSSGALGCIVNERPSYPIAGTGFPLVAVADTEQALVKLARNWRRRLNYKVAVMAASGRDLSARTFEAIKASVPQDFMVQSIDTRLADSKETMITMLSAGPDLKLLLVDLVAASVDSTRSLIHALGPDLCCLSGEPFQYLRLQESAVAIAELTDAMVKELDSRGGLLLYCTESEAEELPAWFSSYPQLKRQCIIETEGSIAENSLVERAAEEIRSWAKI